MQIHTETKECTAAMNREAEKVKARESVKEKVAQKLKSSEIQERVVRDCGTYKN